MPCSLALPTHPFGVPELAEVEYYRSLWDPGIGEKVTRVHYHGEKRVFRGTDLSLVEKIAGQRLQASESSGKQMLFRFSGDLWLGIHLGMTGRLSITAADHSPAKHDHLVLFQLKRALVFNDMRQFGRVLIHKGKQSPEWWSKIGPAVTSKAFTLQRMTDFLKRRAKLPIKAALLMQKGFPGIGNWMADEILWRAGIAPKRLSASLKAAEHVKLWRGVRFVSRQALKKIAKDFGDPPANWLFHERWKRHGHCPKHKTPLRKDTIGGRPTAWCPKCQR
jgi:formamidopyrimidine-DNA glycosylase